MALGPAATNWLHLGRWGCGPHPRVGAWEPIPSPATLGFALPSLSWSPGSPVRHCIALLLLATSPPCPPPHRPFFPYALTCSPSRSPVQQFVVLSLPRLLRFSAHLFTSLTSSSLRGRCAFPLTCSPALVVAALAPLHSPVPPTSSLVVAALALLFRSHVNQIEVFLLPRSLRLGAHLFSRLKSCCPRSLRFSAHLFTALGVVVAALSLSSPALGRLPVTALGATSTCCCSVRLAVAALGMTSCYLFPSVVAVIGSPSRSHVPSLRLAVVLKVLLVGFRLCCLQGLHVVDPCCLDVV